MEAYWQTGLGKNALRATLPLSSKLIVGSIKGKAYTQRSAAADSGDGAGTGGGRRKSSAPGAGSAGAGGDDASKVGVVKPFLHPIPSHHSHSRFCRLCCRYSSIQMFAVKILDSKSQTEVLKIAHSELVVMRLFVCGLEDCLKRHHGGGAGGGER